MDLSQYKNVNRMKIDAIIISVLYNHFYQMKMKGRKVLPWFQTVSVLSFAIVITGVLIYFILSMMANKGHYEMNFSEISFLFAFVCLLILLFILIKRFYFDTNKHLLYLEELNALAPAKRRTNKIWVLATIVLLPFLLLAVLYLVDKR